MTSNISTRCPGCGVWDLTGAIAHADGCPTLKPKPHPLGIGPSDWAVGESNTRRTLVYEKQDGNPCIGSVASVAEGGLSLERPAAAGVRRAFLIAASPKLWVDAAAVVQPFRELISQAAKSGDRTVIEVANLALTELEYALHACTPEGAALAKEPQGDESCLGISDNG